MIISSGLAICFFVFKSIIGCASPVHILIPSPSIQSLPNNNFFPSPIAFKLAPLIDVLSPIFIVVSFPRILKSPEIITASLPIYKKLFFPLILMFKFLIKQY